MGRELWGKLFARAGEELLEFFYPRDCLECQAPLGRGSEWRYLCEVCAQRRVWKVTLPACSVCGHPFYGKVEDEEERHCEHCERLVPCFGEGKTLFLLRKAGRSWIHQIKYHGGRHLLRDVGKLIREREDLTTYFDHRILVPVPLHPRKERERGYNQSRWIAEELAGLAKHSRVEFPIFRTRDSGSQTLLGRRERISNLKNTFALRRNHLISKHNSYLIIDDVFTTGATLNACAQVLLEAGAGRVDVFTLGHG